VLTHVTERFADTCDGMLCWHTTGRTRKECYVHENVAYMLCSYGIPLYQSCRWGESHAEGAGVVRGACAHLL